MNGHWILLLVGAALAACSSTHKNAQPTTCAAMHGIYWVSYERISGDCGDIPAQLVNLDAAPTSCTNKLMDEPGACRQQADVACPTPDGGTVHVVGALTIENANADLAHSIATVTIFGPSGAGLCTGSYRLSYVRQ